MDAFQHFAVTNNKAAANIFLADVFSESVQIYLSNFDCSFFSVSKKHTSFRTDSDYRMTFHLNAFIIVATTVLCSEIESRMTLIEFQRAIWNVLRKNEYVFWNLKHRAQFRC